jgi:hypothetical protein
MRSDLAIIAFLRKRPPSTQAVSTPAAVPAATVTNAKSDPSPTVHQAHGERSRNREFYRIFAN